MKRMAFLLGGTYCASGKQLPGVAADIRAWKQFLISPLGGFWNSDEIIDMSGWDKVTVSQELRRGAEVDYSLVCFSGHGCLVKDRFGFPVTKVSVSDHDEMLEYDLNPGSPWCTMVLDCCRTRPDEEKVAFANEENALSWLGDTTVRFEEELKKCEKGCVTVYAADMGESAEDSRSFSRVLISVAQNPNNYTDGILRIDQAVRLAGEALPPQQNPVYGGGRRRRHFPFAVLPKSRFL